MRVVIQRTAHASVVIDGREKSAIGPGMLILVGIEEADGQEDIDWLCRKITNLRIFDDEQGVMNRSILESGGDIIRAARPETAIPLYEQFCRSLSDALGKPVATGQFGADMKVTLLNDGPVTICMDTKNKE